MLNNYFANWERKMCTKRYSDSDPVTCWLRWHFLGFRRNVNFCKIHIAQGFIESSLGTSRILFYNIPISLRPSWIWCEKVYPSFIFRILNRNITPNIPVVYNKFGNISPFAFQGSKYLIPFLLVLGAEYDKKGKEYEDVWE